MSTKAWTTKEIQVLQRGFEMGFGSTHKVWKRLLPGRSTSAIAYQAKKYGLSTRSYKHWIPEEDELIGAVMDTLARELRTTPRKLMGHIATLHQSKSRRKD
ncbi:hypothetical protein [Atopobium fossor]|uniref:hypothetical protein n=1 Tax=Atopobium fossor TaxID=39487 RepID=UPI000483BF65|nr:hypothetical protein [Atopobium fossor]